MWFQLNVYLSKYPTQTLNIYGPHALLLGTLSISETLLGSFILDGSWAKITYESWRCHGELKNVRSYCCQRGACPGRCWPGHCPRQTWTLEARARAFWGCLQQKCQSPPEPESARVCLSEGARWERQIQRQYQRACWRVWFGLDG